MITYCHNLWNYIDDIFREILDNSFIKELADGTLKPESFQHYICQDSLYLIEFSKNLAVAATKSDDADIQLKLLTLATDALVARKTLHSFYFEEFKIIHNNKKTATCQLYTSYLFDIGATTSFEELLAALLPCFWIYSEVGKYVCKIQTKPNKYQKWIDAYSVTNFDATINTMLDICENILPKSSETMQLKIQKAFIHTSKFEHLFWQSSYDLESALY